MNLFHTMKTYRITASIPEYLHDQLMYSVPTGGRSEFIARALEERINKIKTHKENNAYHQFFSAQKKYPIVKTSIEIRKAIDLGRI